MTPWIDVDCPDRRGPTRALCRRLARRVRRAARAMGWTRAQIDALELRIVDDAAMRVLKAEHFGVDEATDVLSFPAAGPLPEPGLGPWPGPDGEPGPGPGPGLDVDALGSLVINRDAVVRQAVGPGPGAWLDEATSLLVHGLAHLQGHDHDRPDRARRMLRHERRGCRAVGLPCWRPYGRGGGGRSPGGRR
ncbi:MAG: rRNA maturation RNase YbeY [Myxococcota bacterium]